MRWKSYLSNNLAVNNILCEITDFPNTSYCVPYVSCSVDSCK